MVLQMTQALASDHPLRLGPYTATGSLGLARSLLGFHPLCWVSHCCHEMPDEQLWGREMGNTFGTQLGACVLQSIMVGKARQQVPSWEVLCTLPKEKDSHQCHSDTSLATCISDPRARRTGVLVVTMLWE